jgi:glycosyltransferase involved in cell wall biosynthesis
MDHPIKAAEARKRPQDRQPMPKVCLVTSEIVGPFKNGGIGTHNYYLMQYLAEIDDIACTVIYNGAIESKDYNHWATRFKSEYNAEFVWISPDHSDPKPRALSSCYWERISQANLDYLRDQNFDIILFQEMLGGGFRTIQAKKSLGLFPNTLLAVMVHSSWQWVNESMRLFPVYGLPEMLTKYMERYSVEHCDTLVSPSQYMLDWSATDVESLPKQQHVLPYLFDPALSKAGPREAVRELIFFGRLEQRKGLILFLDSLLALLDDQGEQKASDHIPVYFLGRPGQTEDGDGAKTIERFRPLLERRFQLNIISNLGHHEALEFLRSHPAAMVACPSLQDNSPFAVIENILLGTNLISCRTGGIPELFADDSRLAEPTVTDLSRLIRTGLEGTLPDLRAAYSIEKARLAWREFFATHLEEARFDPGKSDSASAIPAFPAEPKLALITAATDAVTTNESASRFRQLSILGGEQLVSNPQTLFAEAEGASHVLVLGAGFDLESSAENAVVAAIHACPDCVWTGFAEYRSPEPVLDTPLGPCLESVLAENNLGNGLAILPTSIFVNLDSRGLMLLQQALSNPCFFWSWLAHLALSGHSMDVIPQTLCYTTDTRWQPLPSASLYSQRAEIVASMACQLPRWTRRLLPYILEITPTLQSRTEGAASSPIEDRRSLTSLLRYYWRRMRG